MIPLTLIQRLRADIQTDEDGRISLELFSSPATDDDLAELLCLKNLRELYVIRGRTGDASLSHVGQMTQLELLSLGETPVTDQGLAYLSRLTRLKVLSLCGTQVSDAGLVHLHGMRRLRILNLSQTNVTEEGVTGLRKELPDTFVFFKGRPPALRLALSSVLLPRLGSRPI